MRCPTENRAILFLFLRVGLFFVLCHFVGGFIFGVIAFPKYFYFVWVPLILFSFPLTFLSIPCIIINELIIIILDHKTKNNILKYFIVNSISIIFCIALFHKHIFYEIERKSFSIAFIISIFFAAILISNVQLKTYKRIRFRRPPVPGKELRWL